MIGKLNTQKLKSALESRGLNSFTELANISGIHRNTLYPYLRGEKSIYSPTILQISNFLKIDPIEFCDSSDKSIIPEIKSIAENLISQFSNQYPSLAIVLFGSRAKGNAKKYSDFDLGVTNGRKDITYKDFLSMKEHISNLADDLIYKVDLVNLDSAPEWFLSNLLLIDKAGEEKGIILISGSPDTYHFLNGRIYEASKKEKIN